MAAALLDASQRATFMTGITAAMGHGAGLMLHMQQQMEAQHGNGLQPVPWTGLTAEALIQGLPGLLPKAKYGSIQTGASLQACNC